MKKLFKIEKMTQNRKKYSKSKKWSQNSKNRLKMETAKIGRIRANLKKFSQNRKIDLK